MEIKYSKFDFNRKDIYFFLFFLIGSNPFIYFNSSNFGELLDSSIFFLYLAYRFYFILKLKNETNIKIENKVLFIENKNYRKFINFEDIKKIIIRKNFFSSYDIVINFDETISLFRYLCNYFLDVSIGKNHNKSYVICDVKNKDDVIKEILDELNIKENNEIEKETLVIKYSLLEKETLLLFLILVILIIFGNRIILGMYFFVIILKILKKKYTYKKIDKKTIKIEDKHKTIYVMEDFIEDKNYLKINYKSNSILSKFNFYYFLYDVLPSRYKIIKQEVH